MKLAITSFLFLFLFICAENAQTTKLPKELVNRSWTRAVTIRDGNSIDYTIFFKQDSTFKLENKTTKFSVTLKIKFEKDKITFPSGSGCNEEGTYKFEIKGNELKLKPESNDCSTRKETLEGIWKTSNKVKK